MSISYHEYLLTQEWKDKAFKCKELADFKCIKCGYEANLQAHHKHYDNIGNEPQDDLVCLCDVCHKLEHRKPVTDKMKEKQKTNFGNIPPFFMIGVNYMFDSIDVFRNMTEREYKVLQMLIDNIEIKTNISDLNMARWMETKSDRAIFSYGMRLLKSKNLVHNVGGRKSKVYMINPDFIQPASALYKDLVLKFKELT